MRRNAMPHEFLTLEGHPSRRRRARPTGLGFAPITQAPLSPEAAAARIAAQKAQVESRREAMEEAQYRDFTAAEASAHGAKRPELFTHASFSLKDNAPTIFKAYGIPGLESYSPSDLGELAVLGLASDGVQFQRVSDTFLRGLGNMVAASLAGLDFYDSEDDGSLGFFKRIRRMFTPPRSVRQVFSDAYRSVSKVKVAQALRPVTKMKLPQTFKKIVRYAGAVNTLPLTLASGKLRNQVFGLKGSEIAVFDKAAKVGRITAAAAASIVGAPAIAGAMGPKAGAAFLKAQGSGFLGKGIGSKLASFVVKDAATKSLWRITKDAAGKLIGEKFQADQIPAEEYAMLPDSVPVPSATEPNLISTPAFVGGSSSMEPFTQTSPAPAQYGEVEPFAESTREQSEGIIAATRLNPEERVAYLSPERTEQLTEAIYGEDNDSLKDLIAARKLEMSSMESQDSLEAEVDESGLPTLRALAAYNRRRARSRRPSPGAARPAPRARSRPMTLADLLMLNTPQARMTRLHSIVNE